MEEKEDRIIKGLFKKAEISYTVADISKAIGPMIDLLFISRFIGTGGVTVIGYVGPLIMLFEMAGTLISSGARNKVSSLIGAGEIDEASRAFSASLITGGGIAFAAALIAALLCSPLAFALGARDAAVRGMTVQYIRGYLVGFPFFTLTRIMTPFLQMEGEYRRVDVISVLTTVIDVAADIFVIFVLSGGMFEIGFATSLGYIIPFFISAAFFMRSGTVFRFSFKGFDPGLSCEMLRLGAPAGIVKGSSFAGGVAVNNMLTALGRPYLVAALGVFSQISVFLRSSWYAPADTLHAFAGVFIGEEDRASLKLAQRTCLCHALSYTAAAAALLFVLAQPLAAVFLKSDDPQALSLAAECIRICCLALPFHAAVYSFNNYLMAVKKLSFCSLYSFLIECGCPVIAAFVCIKLFGYHGAFIAKPAAMLLLLVIAAIYINRHEGGRLSDRMLLLPKSFGIPREDEITATAVSAGDIADLSKIAVAFALEHGAEKDRALTFGLITEEIAGMLSDHGFSDGKPHSINARLIAKDGDLLVRVRDDCAPFNVTEYYDLIRKDRDAGKEMSLALIMKISKDVKYTATFGANTLIVRI